MTPQKIPFDDTVAVIEVENKEASEDPIATINLDDSMANVGM